MGKRFQFSMRRMLGAVALWCLCAALFSWVLDAGLYGGYFAVTVAAGASLGGGFGLLIRKPILCAVVAGGLTVPGMFVYVIWYVSTHSICC